MEKETIELVKKMIEDGNLSQEIAEKYIPELKEESKDEKIRKELLIDIPKVFSHDKAFKYIAWLEKQGEHANFCNKIQVDDKVTRNQDDVLVNLSQLERVAKPTDKIVPKFKIGDWVVIDGEVLHIEEVTEDGYFTDEGGLIPFRNEKEAHIWTIQDAKTGNVLACESGWTCIFKTLVNDETFSSYCFMDNTKWFCETGSECHTLKDEFIKAYNGKIYPATKEQCNLLFQKMKEAGYEWDAEKKELKKIEQNPANVFNIYEKSLLEKFKQAVYDCAWGKVTCKEEGETQEEYAERWSEQFLLMVRDWADDYIDFTIQQKLRNSYEKGKTDAIEKLHEQKPAWSEEGENNILFLTSIIEECFKDKEKITLHGDTACANFTKEDVIDRLKSLRPQKPLTNEEIEQAKKEYRDVALSKMDYIPEELTYDNGWDDAISYMKSR